MVTSVFLIVCIMRVLLVWQMVELLKNIRNPKNNTIATVGFLIYVFYLVLSTITGIPVSAESIIRLLGTLLILVGANRCFGILYKKGDI